MAEWFTENCSSDPMRQALTAEYTTAQEHCTKLFLKRKFSLEVQNNTAFLDPGQGRCCTVYPARPLPPHHLRNTNTAMLRRFFILLRTHKIHRDLEIVFWDTAMDTNWRGFWRHTHYSMVSSNILWWVLQGTHTLWWVLKGMQISHTLWWVCSHPSVVYLNIVLGMAPVSFRIQIAQTKLHEGEKGEKESLKMSFIGAEGEESVQY